jgi:hypothetical protein
MGTAEAVVEVPTPIPVQGAAGSRVCSSERERMTTWQSRRSSGLR